MTELARIKQYRIDAEKFAEAFAEQLDFIPIIVVPPIPQRVVVHLNGNPYDSQLSNLMVTTSSRASRDNKRMMAFDPEFGPVFEGDTYCIKHQELLTLGFGMDGEIEDACAFCEWGDD
jgi:hypothetical protein